VDSEAAGKMVVLPDGDNRSLLVLRGRLGAADARWLWELAGKLTEAARDITVDCRELEQIGGAPLQVILALRAGLQDRGKRLDITGISPAVARALAVAGVGADLTAG
jgi:anti-anti-sigma regulatory factor